MKEKIFLIGLASFFIVVSAFYLLKLGGESNFLITQLLYLMPPLIAAIGGFYAVKIYGPTNLHGKSLIFLAMGLSSWFIGEIMFLILEVFLKIDAFPSIADFFYLSGYPLFFIGFLKEKFIVGKVERTTRNKIFLSIATIFVSVIVFYFGIYLAYNPEASWLANFIAIFYGVGDLILMIVLLFILSIVWGYKEGKLSRPWMSILLALELYLAADILFAIYNKAYEEQIWLYRQIDLLWIAGYLFFAFGLFKFVFILKKAREAMAAKLLKK